MTSRDGVDRETDGADVETVLRIIQSIPSPAAEPIKQWLARVGARQIEETTRPLPPADVRTAVATMPKPAEEASALDWAHYYEQLAANYRRHAVIETALAEHAAQLEDRDAQLAELHSRMEGAEGGLRMLIEQLGPPTLTPEHQGTVKAYVKRLQAVGGFHPQTTYADLTAAFHVGKFDQIPDEQWPEVVHWFETRLAAAERRRRTP